MTDEFPAMSLKAIGIVHNEVKENPGRQDWWQGLVSEIEIDGNLAEGLDGLEEFSHIIILYWMSKITSDGVPLKVHRRGKKENPPVGVFASRSPNRPNRIGKTTVRLLQRQGNILRVRGLDALDDSPVLDIKPYIHGYDSPSEDEVPR